MKQGITDLGLNVGCGSLATGPELDLTPRPQYWLPTAADGQANRAAAMREIWVPSRGHDVGAVCVAMMATEVMKTVTYFSHTAGTHTLGPHAAFQS